MDGSETESRGGVGKTIDTPPVSDDRISGDGATVFSPLCGLRPPGYGETLGYLYTLPTQHKAVWCCSGDHKIILTQAPKEETGATLHITPDTALSMAHAAPP